MSKETITKITAALILAAAVFTYSGISYLSLSERAKHNRFLESAAKHQACIERLKLYSNSHADFPPCADRPEFAEY